MYRLGKFQAIGVLLGARNNRFGNHWHVEADWIWGLQWGIKDKSEFHWHDGYVQTLQFQYFTSDGSTPLIQMHIWFWDSSFQTWGSFVITVPVSLTSIKQTSKFKSQKSNHTAPFLRSSPSLCLRSPWSNHPHESRAYCPVPPLLLVDNSATSSCR